MPQSPWTHLAADFYLLIPISGQNKYLLVIIDEHSRYPAVEICSSTSSEAMIPLLDKVFAMMGLPEVLEMDNGTPWNGRRLAVFANHLDFKHQKVAPYWSQANGKAEKFMRVIGKTLQTTQITGRPLQQELTDTLRNYRATPHCTTGITPAALLFGLSFKVKFPETRSSTRDGSLLDRDYQKKEKINQDVFQKLHARQRNINIGDTVLMKQKRTNKSAPPYSHKPCVVAARKGTMITAERPGHKITRNASFFKVVSIPGDVPAPDNIHHNEMLDEAEDQLRRQYELPPDFP